MNPFNAMGNNPISFKDPDGDFIFSEIGYNWQKMFSPVAIKINLNFSNPGIEVSLGTPQASLVGYRFHFGASYGFSSYDGGVNGWNSWNGKEVSYLFGFISLNSTQYHSRGIDGTTTSQTLGGIKIGTPFVYLKYQNDWQPEKAQWYAPGMDFGDEGDRWRSAALQINVYGIKVGFNLFTGDPGPFGARPEDEGSGLFHQGKFIYSNAIADKYRIGNIYFGYGSIRKTYNNELNRHAIQNMFAHDYLQDGQARHFRVTSLNFESYWSYNNGYGTGLW